MEIELLREWNNDVLNNEDAIVIGTLNVEIVASMVTNIEVRELFKKLDIKTVDGKWLQIFLRIFCKIKSKKISGSDLYAIILDHLNLHSKKILIVGGEEQSNARALEILSDKYKKLEFFGHVPEFDDSLGKIESDLKPLIETNDIDFCLMCLGCPKQERIAYGLKKVTNSNLKTLCAGGTVDFISGKRKRASKFFQNYGLEWLYRIKQEPVLRSKRYIKAFFLLIINFRETVKMFVK